MSDEQVQTAIDVLRAYADGSLRTDLCDELDEAIQKAFDVLLSETHTPHYDVERMNEDREGWLNMSNGEEIP